MTNKIIISTIVLLISSLLLFWYFSKDKNEIFYDFEKMPTTLDPQLNNEFIGNVVIKNIFTGLTDLDENSNLVLGAAESHNISDNGKTHTFKLKDGLYWSDKDKTKVTSHDFVFAFKRIFNPETKSPNINKFSFIKNAEKILNNHMPLDSLGVTALDDLTLVFELEYDKKDFLYSLLDTSAMPCNEKFFKEANGSYGIVFEKTVSNGAYKLSETDNKSYLSINKNENYKANSKEVAKTYIKFLIKPSETDRIDRFKKKYTQSLIINKPDESLIKQSSLVSDNSLYYLLFNKDLSIFKNEYIRSALINSINIEELSKKLSSNLSMPKSPFPNNLEIDNKLIIDLKEKSKLNNYNLQKSIQELGIGMKQLGITSLGDISIMIPENYQNKEIISSITQIWQRDLKVFVNIKEVPLNNIQKYVNDGQYNIALTNIKSDLYSLKDSLNNFFNVNKINITQNIRDILNNIEFKSNDEKLKYIIELENYILSQNIFIPLYTEKTYFLVGNGAKNIYYHPQYSFIDFKYAN